MSGLDTEKEDDQMFEIFADYMSGIDLNEWKEASKDYEHRMDKILASKYGIIPRDDNGMISIMDIAVKEYEKDRDNVDLSEDSLFVYCVCIPWCYVMDNGYYKYETGNDNEYTKILDKLHNFEPDKDIIDKAWNMIKEKISKARSGKDIESLLQAALGLNAFEQCYRRYKKA